MTSYLVQYGRSAFLGWFEAAVGFARDDRVVIHGPRGQEIGTILCEPGPSQPDRTDGEILRLAVEADSADAERNESLAAEILAEAEQGIADAGLPLSLIDIELSLDGKQAILHALPWAACDATSLLELLSTRFGLAIRLLDLSRTPTVTDPSSTGCGKPGCGGESGGCGSCGPGGCSTTSCSRGKVKSADDLTAYFAELRRNMEARTPLA